MGMYDEIKCNYPVPKGRGHIFQTKSLDCQMERYELSESKWLFKTTEMKGCWEFRELDPPQLFKYTGEIRFYIYGTDEDDKEWLEYVALFIKGKLKHIERVE